MFKRITRAVLFSISILTSYLITGAIETRVLSETEHFRPITATIIGMVIIVLIYAPIYAYTERITQAVVKAGMQQSKAGAGKIVGAVLFVALAFLILWLSSSKNGLT